MISRFVLLALILTSNYYSVIGQNNIFEDTSFVFRDGNGKVLTRQEMKNLISSGPFKMNQSTNMITGEKIVTLILIDSLEQKRNREEIERRVARLKGRNFEVPHFTDLSKRSYDTESFKGKITVVNFWFTACKPCIEEMPGLNKLVRVYAGKGVSFISFCSDFSEDINKFLEKHTFDYPIIPNSSEFAEKIGVEVFPTHLIVDKNGVIQNVLIGGSKDIYQTVGDLIEKVIK